MLATFQPQADRLSHINISNVERSRSLVRKRTIYNIYFCPIFEFFVSTYIFIYICGRIVTCSLFVRQVLWQQSIAIKFRQHGCIAVCHFWFVRRLVAWLGWLCTYVCIIWLLWLYIRYRLKPLIHFRFFFFCFMWCMQQIKSNYCGTKWCRVNKLAGYIAASAARAVIEVTRLSLCWCSLNFLR